jgi:hypothetical protein
MSGAQSTEHLVPKEVRMRFTMISGLAFAFVLSTSLAACVADAETKTGREAIGKESAESVTPAKPEGDEANEPSKPEGNEANEPSKPEGDEANEPSKREGDEANGSDGTG